MTRYRHHAQTTIVAIVRQDGAFYWADYRVTWPSGQIKRFSCRIFCLGCHLRKAAELALYVNFTTILQYPNGNCKRRRSCSSSPMSR
ncbi:hypothetical protein PRJ_0812 [Pseudomonas sp. XWY-1]|uniref:Uncharacterized protein n=1 Tax=Pseudomonas putida (strain DOT-T1E) TaxID=1196325 RepID=I7CB63_PSEPT|nr:hypothetical protein T1E_3263 [Pseudomonas putida DOT-T1E]AUZ57434.1 hypothetical protein PRJ_0812 [Pseudomonas sp. XWY-1]